MTKLFIEAIEAIDPDSWEARLGATFKVLLSNGDYLGGCVDWSDTPPSANDLGYLKLLIIDEAAKPAGHIPEGYKISLITSKSDYEAAVDRLSERNPGFKSALQRKTKFLREATASWASIVRKATGYTES